MYLATYLTEDRVARIIVITTNTAVENIIILDHRVISAAKIAPILTIHIIDPARSVE